MAQAQTIFDENFLSIRAKLIEVAAILDRIDRAASTDNAAAALEQDPRRQRVEQAISLLLREATDPGHRTQALQQLFSNRYDPAWREQFGL